MRFPVPKIVKQFCLFIVGSQEVQNPAFQERAALLRCDWSAEFLHRADQARVNPIELWVAPLANSQPRLKGWQAKGKQGVVKNTQVALHCSTRHATIARKSCDVDNLTVTECCSWQEASKSREVPDKSFGSDILAEVGQGIAL